LRLAVGGSLQAEQPGAGEIVEIVTAAVVKRPGLSVAGERRDHEFRIELEHALVSDAEPIEHARTKLLEDDVIMNDEPFECANAVRPRQIEDSAPFAAVQRVESRALTTDDRWK
jgi:hypothetical protein